VRAVVDKADAKVTLDPSHGNQGPKAEASLDLCGRPWKGDARIRSFVAADLRLDPPKSAIQLLSVGVA
jgi:hypothetical protein